MRPAREDEWFAPLFGVLRFRFEESDPREHLSWLGEFYTPATAREVKSACGIVGQAAVVDLARIERVTCDDCLAAIAANRLAASGDP